VLEDAPLTFGNTDPNPRKIPKIMSVDAILFGENEAPHFKDRDCMAFLMV